MVLFPFPNFAIIIFINTVLLHRIESLTIFILALDVEQAVIDAAFLSSCNFYLISVSVGWLVSYT